MMCFEGLKIVLDSVSCASLAELYSMSVLWIYVIFGRKIDPLANLLPKAIRQPAEASASLDKAIYN
jgi:hypothetical protein